MRSFRSILGAFIAAIGFSSGVNLAATKLGNILNFREPRLPLWRPPGPIVPRSRSKKYPEQSTRQHLRGFRRAQGGAGVTLIDGHYYPNWA